MRLYAYLCRAGLAGFLLFMSQAINVEVLVAQSPSVPFTVGSSGASALATEGNSDTISVGYAEIKPDASNTTPSGVAIFGLSQNGILISEAGVPASAPVLGGRIYAEVNGPLNTGLAIANPNGQEAVITYYFSDETRPSFGENQTAIPAGGHIAAFLNEEPFNAESPISGTFTFSSNVPVAAVALRGLTNGRSEFLMTTLPVSPLTTQIDAIVYFPHFADGEGWSTEVVLVNPTDDPMTGTVEFLGQGSSIEDAQPVDVTIGTQTAATFGYTIPGRSSRRLQTAGTNTTVQVGSVRATPTEGGMSPAGLSIFSFKVGSVTGVEAGVPAAQTGQAFRVYAEASETEASIQTGIALVNPAATSIAVLYELLSLDGTSTGLTGSVSIAGNGHTAQFLNQIEGFESLTAPFQGVLRISTTAGTGIAVVGLRIRYNERGEFLITTTAPVDEADPGVSSSLFFPHLADGGGFTTQFILLGGTTSDTRSGDLQFFGGTGDSLALETSNSSSTPSSDAVTVTWSHDGTTWSSASTPPDCPDPLILTPPAPVSLATGVIYPGQVRGGHYKAHGGLAFNSEDPNVLVTAPMDAVIVDGVRYLQNGVVQYMFDFINSCGIWHRLDHLLELSPRFQALADTLPEPEELQSMTTNFTPGLTVSEGEVIATQIGIPGINIFFDWGVYDLRQMNESSMDPDWLAAHPGEQAPYAICWLENLSAEDQVIVNALPTGVEGATSDYCN